MYNNCFIENRISCICDCEYQFFLSKKNVQGIGLGCKEVNGICTCRKCIKVFVSQKLPINCIDMKDLVPACYKGIQTDVVQSGVFTPAGLTGKVRPAPGGYSIGPKGSNTAGTLGCLAINKSEKAIYILSTSHILSNAGALSKGTPILQPGILDGGSLQTDVVANLTRYVPIKYKTHFTTPVNYVDAAVAKVTSSSLVSPNIAIVNRRIKGIGVAQVGDHVFKVGRTTERTDGIVTAINVTQLVNYPKGKALFKDQTIAKLGTDKGDSGSMLITQDMQALGMLSSNGDNGQYGLFSDLIHITSQLHIQLVTQNDLMNYTNMFY